ncbi:hypothetical protein SAMN02746066_04043 [Anaerosporobacter mobilis DSM 15930]|jgi:hypothetical protein|uniref:Uncharacterized protein n=1 Tax=Anaerosporobacter mobilis DSM 15930 TaxID=1120996 RepID=A0A1M7MVG1_9FIRM|nr:hypothetical protein [Anaerosporobacter mobilis]SHM95034.1 hypothetical protein SAMN02746066_04043 [Anaerosporobacter mobilis DSM 15930]
MATETKNLKLSKPDKTDFYNIDLVNTNMDKIDKAIGEKADKTEITITKTIQAVLSGTSWVGSAAPYTQTITVDGILSTDNPIVDVILSDLLGTAILEEKAWGNISKIVTHDGSITAICNKKKPVTGVKIQLKVVK